MRNGIGDHHVHTSMCHHAEGTPREYVESAIKQGLCSIGFNDHFPMRYLPKTIPVECYAMELDEFPGYLATVKALRDQFSGSIDVKVAAEVDYYEPRKDDIYKQLEPFLKEFDYVYGSVHVVEDWAVDDERFLKRWNERGENAVYSDYYEAIRLMAREKKFDVVGHFDLPKKYLKFPTKDMNDAIAAALDAIKNARMVVEVNTAGLRKPVKEIYPSEAILVQCLDRDIPVTLGSDAHAPAEVGYAFRETLSLLARLGFTSLTTFEVRKRRDIPLEGRAL